MGYLSDLFAGKKGQDIGNTFGDYQTGEDARGAVKGLFGYQGSNAALDPLESSRIASKEVMDNPILGQLYGDKGALSRALGQEQDLSQRGYSLQPEDYEAYGQGAGNIARNFDVAGQNVAQELASRGLSQSGSAPRAFMTSQGNKLEQLGGLQRKIADDRMQSNMQRLAQTRQYATQLGGMGQNAIQDQYGRQLGSEQTRFGQQQAKANTGMNWLGQAQAGKQAQAQHQAQTATGGVAGAFTKGLSGALQGGLEALPQAFGAKPAKVVE